MNDFFKFEFYFETQMTIFFQCDQVNDQSVFEAPRRRNRGDRKGALYCICLMVTHTEAKLIYTLNMEMSMEIPVKR